MFPDNSALKEIMVLDCFCLFKQAGCDWQGPIHSLEEHVTTCAFGMDQPCPWNLGCQFTGSRQAMQTHLETEVLKHNKMYTAELYQLGEQLKRTLGQLSKMLKDSAQIQTQYKLNQNDLNCVRDTIGQISQFITVNNLQTAETKEWIKEFLTRLEGLEQATGQSSSENFKDTLANLKNKSQELQLVISTKFGLEIGDNSGSPHASLSAMANATPASLDSAIQRVEKTGTLAAAQLKDLDLKIRLFQSTTFDGTYVWKLDDLERRFNSALTGKITELYTPPLYTSPFGYKFCAKVLLNGDPNASVDSLGSHIAFYIVLMQGDFDEILKFPFPHSIKISLLDLNRKKDITETLKPQPGTPSFEKPNMDMNPAVGFPQFCSHQVLYSNGNYVKDDAVYFKLEVVEAAV